MAIRELWTVHSDHSVIIHAAGAKKQEPSYADRHIVLYKERERETAVDAERYGHARVPRFRPPVINSRDLK